MYLDAAIPLAPAATLDVHIPNDDMGRIDDFIDDGIAIVPDLNDNKSRGVQALLLAIHILFRPVDQNENIPRRLPLVRQTIRRRKTFRGFNNLGMDYKHQMPHLITTKEKIPTLDKGLTRRHLKQESFH